MHLPRLEGWGDKPPVKNGPSLGGYGAVAMNAALTTSMTTLPEQLRKRLTQLRLTPDAVQGGSDSLDVALPTTAP